MLDALDGVADPAPGVRFPTRKLDERPNVIVLSLSGGGGSLIGEKNVERGRSAVRMDDERLSEPVPFSSVRLAGLSNFFVSVLVKLSRVESPNKLRLGFGWASLDVRLLVVLLLFPRMPEPCANRENTESVFLGGDSRSCDNAKREPCVSSFSGLEDLDLDLARSVDGSSSLTEEESSFSAGRNCRASRVRQLSSGDDVVTASVNDRSGSCWPDCCGSASLVREGRSRRTLMALAPLAVITAVSLSSRGPNLSFQRCSRRSFSSELTAIPWLLLLPIAVCG